jgi:hypothetical protein
VYIPWFHPYNNAKGTDMVTKRPAATAIAFTLLAGIGTGLWSAREARSQGPPDGPWLDAQGGPLPDGALTIFRGHEHCDWQPVTFMDLGWPLGTPVASPLQENTYRQYVRDPEGVLHSSFSLSFDLDPTLPAAAETTGYHSGDWELWINESEADRFIYLVNGARVERWPRADPPIYCK